jgi:hypothetical protein
VPEQPHCDQLKRWVKVFKEESVLFVSNKHLIALAERTPAIPEIVAKRNKAKLKLHHDLGSYEDILFVYMLAEDEAAPGHYKPITPVQKDFELETIEEILLGRGRMLRLARLIDVHWLEDDVREVDLSGYNALEPGMETLQFYARTLP